MLRAALDATPLLGRRTGIGVAVAGFFESLRDRPDLAVDGYGLTARGWRRLAGELPDGIGVKSRPSPAALMLRAWSRGDWPTGEWWTGEPDVVHGTNFVVPPTRRAARVVSVWDMTAVRYPELCTATARRYPLLVARAVASGAWVHTAAESVAAEVAHHFHLSREVVRVVPPPVALPAGTPVAGPPGRPYVLSVARSEPRKDLPALVRAFDAIAGRHPDLELRLAGPPGWAEPALADAIAASRYRSRIRRLGWVDDMEALIAHASVFAYPSLYEGFGLPPLEAMARGVPVVATAAGAVPEVVGDAAALVPPGDPEALAAAIDEIVGAGPRRARLVAAGTRRVALFSHERTGRALADLYRDVAGAAR